MSVEWLGTFQGEVKSGWMELVTGKFSVPHQLLGPASVFTFVEV